MRLEYGLYISNAFSAPCLPHVPYGLALRDGDVCQIEIGLQGGYLAARVIIIGEGEGSQLSYLPK